MAINYTQNLPDVPFSGQTGLEGQRGHFTQLPYGVNSMNIPVCGSLVTVTSAQLLALPGTKLQIVDAPRLASGAANLHNVLLPKKLFVEYFYGGTAYTIAVDDNDFQIEYTGKSVALMTVPATGLVDQTASTVVAVSSLAAGNLAVTNCAGLGLELTLVGTTPALTLGNGTLYLTLEYTIGYVF
jgi:hypothetical protein